MTSVIVPSRLLPNNSEGVRRSVNWEHPILRDCVHVTWFEEGKLVRNGRAPQAAIIGGDTIGRRAHHTVDDGRVFVTVDAEKFSYDGTEDRAQIVFANTTSAETYAEWCSYNVSQRECLSVNGLNSLFYQCGANVYAVDYGVYLRYNTDALMAGTVKTSADGTGADFINIMQSTKEGGIEFGSVGERNYSTTSGTASFETYGQSGSTTTRSLVGTIYYVITLKRLLHRAEFELLAQDPWQIFKGPF